MGKQNIWLAALVAAVSVLLGGTALTMSGALTPGATPTTPSTPSPTDTPDPVPVPAPSVPPRPVVDERTAGVPEGTELRVVGRIEVTRPGAVIERLDVQGEIIIAADDVVVRNTRVATSTSLYPIHVRPGVTGALIEHVEVDNLGSDGKGIYFDDSSGTVRYADIHSAEDGIRISGSDVTIEHSYIHHLARTETSHNDAIQIRRGHDVVIRGNNLQAYNPDTDDPMNAAIQVGSLVGDEPIQNLTVVDNLMNGGNFTVNGGGRGEVEHAVYSGNRFGRQFRFGIAGNIENSQWDETNVFDDNGEPVR